MSAGRKPFANSLPGKPLKDRTGKDIEAFLADLRTRRGIADWQVRQAQHALKILYEIFLPDYAPERDTAMLPAGKEFWYQANIVHFYTPEYVC
jgi:hypothetical protein